MRITKVRNILSIIIFIIHISLLKGQVNFIWAKSIAGSETLCAGACLGLDPNGNVYTTGYFNGTSDFDPNGGVYNMISAGSKDIFISKLDQNGAFVWTKSIGGVGEDVGQSIFVDASANSFITGYFNGTVDFDPGPGTFSISSVGQQDIFILKLDVNGNFVWAKNIGSAYDDYGYSIICDALGNVYSTGYFNGTADFDPGIGTFTLTTIFHDIFISKLNSSGNFVWAISMGGSNQDAGYSIATDLSGNIYTTGVFSGIADFDPSIGSYTLASVNSGLDVFVSKIDPAGSFQWAKSFGTMGIDRGTSITIDVGGNVYTTGMFNSLGSCDFDPGPSVYTLTSGGGWDAFISKLDPLGNFIWAKKLSGLLYEEGTSIETDALGNVYSTGTFSGTTDFDPGPGIYTLTTSGNADIYINMLDVSGNFVWAKSMGGVNQDFGYSLALDLIGNIYSAGFYNGIADFDPGVAVYNLTTAIGQDVYVHKMNQCLVPDAPSNLTPSVNLNICANTAATLIVNASGTINWFSTQNSTVSINTGSVFITSTLSPGTYTYYAEATTCTLSTRTPVTLTVSVCNSIFDYSLMNEELIIYPNPNNGKFMVLNSGINNLIEIFDITGKLILKTISSENTLIDLEGNDKGVYNYRISNSEIELKRGKILIK